MSTRVVIADDQQLVRVGFEMILSAQSDIEVVGEAADGRQAVSICAQLRPDVVLMDIRMPELDGIAATRKIIAEAGDPQPRVVILTTFDLDEYVYDALRAGASGFLLKDVPPEQLIAAVRMIQRGDALLAASITRRLIEEFTAPRRSPPALPGLSELSPREREVFELLARGLSNQEIAAQLFLGGTTVKTHVARILTKLHARDRVQAIVLAYESGVVTPSTTGEDA